MHVGLFHEMQNGGSKEHDLIIRMTGDEQNSFAVDAFRVGKRLPRHNEHVEEHACREINEKEQY